jgi:hypothetical protein
MNEDGRELVERMHREAVERYLEQKQKERELVERVFREALEQGRVQPLPPYKPPTIHYTELPEAPPDSPLCQEWNFYRHEVGRLLADGHEGKFVLIKGEAIIGIWGTREEAKDVALQRYLMQPCLIQQVRSREPLLRISPRLRR